MFLFQICNYLFENKESLTFLKRMKSTHKSVRGRVSSRFWTTKCADWFRLGTLRWEMSLNQTTQRASFPVWYSLFVKLFIYFYILTTFSPLSYPHVPCPPTPHPHPSAPISPTPFRKKQAFHVNQQNMAWHKLKQDCRRPLLQEVAINI